MRWSRREVLAGSALGLAALGMGCSARRDADFTIGLQLYTLSAALRQDLRGTLERIAAIGIRHVELAQYFDLRAAELRALLKQCGLECVSGHFGAHALTEDLDGRIAYARELGLRYMICADLWVADLTRFDHAAGNDEDEKYYAVLDAFDGDDWRWNAEFFNRVGARVQAAGMRFGYHNHVAEFRRRDGELGYDALLRLTDPALVTMQLDCGWLSVAGLDPADYLRRHPQRFASLHLKDVHRASAGSGSTRPQFVPAGAGAVDWQRTLEAARAAGVRYAYIEIEGNYAPAPLEAVAQSFEYLRGVAG